MNKDIFDINDNEIRVIGSTKHEPEKPNLKHRWWLWVLLAILLLAALYFFWGISRHTRSRVVYSNEPAADTTEVVYYNVKPESEGSPIVSRDSKAYTKVTRDSINDIGLRIYTPVGGHVGLLVGQLPDNDNSIILAAQAADYRADNGQISGAFVYKGELLSRGHPKYGFCTIIGDTLTMGMSKETILFERAVEQEGYFFRQFSLVHDGTFGEKVPKGKAIRRALCYYKKSIAIIETVDYESLHDFSQALIDMGVQESIALVGSIALPLYIDEDGNRITNEIEHQEGAQETYIVWRK